jgi:hypothetical protein
MKNNSVFISVCILVIISLTGLALTIPASKKDHINNSMQTKVTVKTVAVKNVTAKNASCSYSITTENEKVTRQGVCVNKSPKPTTGNNIYSTTGLGPINFSAEITGLSPNTKYYVRAFATTSSSTTYGNELSFTTKPIK